MWEHQRQAFVRFREVDSFGLFFEQGTGKTLTIINILRWRFGVKGRVLRTLIFGPPIVVENWRREWCAFSQVDRRRVVALSGSMAKRIKTFRDAVAADRNTVFITNYEALLKQELLDEFMAWAPEVVVLDESHRVKSYNAKRTKLMYKLAADTDVILATGTPVLQSPMDLFAQFKIMDKKVFGVNFFEFRSRYFYDKNSGMPKDRHFPNWVVRPGTYEQMRHKVEEVAMVVKKQDCLSLPPFVRQKIEVELPSSMRRPYEMMRKHLIAQIEEGDCVAQLALTKALRLLQMASGYIPVVAEKGLKLESKNIPFKENPKALALRELLSDITPHSKVLVWAVFKENYKTIREVCDGLKIDYVEISGERTPKQKQEAVDRLHTDDAVRVLIGHPGSGGIGINLIAASYSIFYSRGYSLEYDLQAEARNYRGGSNRHARVTRIDLVAKDTIDEDVAEALAAKQTVSDRILLGMLKERDHE